MCTHAHVRIYMLGIEPRVFSMLSTCCTPTPSCISLLRLSILPFVSSRFWIPHLRTIFIMTVLKIFHVGICFLFLLQFVIFLVLSIMYDFPKAYIFYYIIRFCIFFKPSVLADFFWHCFGRGTVVATLLIPGRGRSPSSLLRPHWHPKQKTLYTVGQRLELWQSLHGLHNHYNGSASSPLDNNGSPKSLTGFLWYLPNEV